MIRYSESRRLFMALIVALSVTTSALASDRAPSGTLKEFQRIGVVDKINSTEVVLNGERFRLSSSVVMEENSRRKTLGSIQIGDVLSVRGRILISVPYIDTMGVLPDEPM